MKFYLDVKGQGMARLNRVQGVSVVILAALVTYVSGGSTPHYDLKWRGLGVTTHGGQNGGQNKCSCVGIGQEKSLLLARTILKLR